MSSGDVMKPIDTGCTGSSESKVACTKAFMHEREVAKGRWAGKSVIVLIHTPQMRISRTLQGMDNGLCTLKYPIARTGRDMEKKSIIYIIFYSSGLSERAGSHRRAVLDIAT